MEMNTNVTFDALGGAPTTKPAADKKGGMSEAAAATYASFKKEAQAEIKQLTEAGNDGILGSKSSSLVFLYMLGNPLNKEKRRVSDVKGADGKTVAKDIPCSKGLGFAFKATEPVELTLIKGKRTTATGYTEADTYTYTAQTGEIVYLTYLELFLLAIKPEYSMMFDSEVNGVFQKNGFRLDVKLSTFCADKTNENKLRLPSPSPALATGSVKETIKDVCKENRTATGEIEWNAPAVAGAPAYAEKFACFFERSTKSMRGTSAPKDNKQKAYETAAICRAIVADMLNRG